MSELSSRLTERVLGGFLSPDREPPEMGLLRSQGAVEQARSEIRYGNLSRGADILEDVARHVDDLAFRRVLGIAYSVWGQGLETWGNAEEATTYFHRAIDTFVEASGPDLGLDALVESMGPRALGDVGMALAGIGDHERAERALRDSRRYGPTTPEATRRLAGYAAAHGELDVAADLLREVLPVLPTDAQAWYTAARIRERLGEPGVVAAYRQAAVLWLQRSAFDQALPAMRRLLELQAEVPENLIALVEALRSSGRVVEAEELADRAVAAFPQSLQAWLARALVRRQLGRLAEALADTDAALAIDEFEPTALLVRAYVEADREALEQSLQYAARVLEVEPDNRLAEAHKGLVLMRMGRYAEAREPLLSAHLALRDDIELTKSYALLAWHLDERAVVIETLAPVWRHPALGSLDIAHLVDALFQQDQAEDALRVARVRSEQDPDNPDLRRILGSAIARHAYGQDPWGHEFTAAVDEAAYLAPDDPDVLVVRGVRARSREDEVEAETLFRVALERAPDHVEALKQLVELLLDRRRLAEAEAFARTGLLLTDDPYFRLQTAITLREQKREREVVRLLADPPPDVGPYGTTWLQVRAEAQEALAHWAAAQKDRAEVAAARDDPESWFALSEVARLAGDWETAVEASERVLAVRPDDVRALGSLGAALAMAGRREEARAAFDEAIANDPAYEFGVMEKARLADNLEEALGLLARLEPVTRDFTGLRVHRGWLLLEHERLVDALAEFETVLGDEPDSVDALSGAAICHTHLGQPDQAVTLARRAVELAPDDSVALRSLAAAKKDTGSPREAVLLLRHAMEIRPDDASLVGVLAESLKLLDQVDESIELVSAIAQRRPGDGEAWAVLGQHLTSLGNFDEAIVPLRRSLELNPNNAWTHNNLGWSLMHAVVPDFEAARYEFDEASRLAPGRLIITKNQAEAHHFLGSDDAKSLYRRAIELGQLGSGNSLFTRWVVGWCLFRLRELSPAGRHLFAATALPMDGEEVTLDLGLVSLCQGRDEQALQHYETAIAGIAQRNAYRRRSPLRVAQIDLDTACRDFPGLAARRATAEVREKLASLLSGLPPLPALVPRTATPTAPPPRRHDELLI
ncbi:tetratricopeptide repeat protein [Blastococcus sp. SYSU D00922]